MRPTFSQALAQLGVPPDRIEGVLRQVDLGVYIDHVEHGCIYASDPLLDTFDLSWEEFRGFGWAQAVIEADLEILREAIERFEREKGAVEVRYRVRRRDGGWRAVQVFGHPVLNEAGDKLGLILLLEDVTETRKLLDHALQGQKLEAIGRLAGRVAHDFNNVLTPILCSASLLEGEALSEEGRENLETILQSVNHAARITQQLLSLSRHEVRGPTATSLDDELLGLRPMLTQVLGEGVTLRLELDAEASQIGLAVHELGQIVLNLCVNARDAMAGQGAVTLRTRRRGPFCELVVADDGPGIPEDVQQRMFEPFFTTKPVDRGTGLGLASVRALVHRAGGKVRVSSQPGRGTELAVIVPTIATSVRDRAIPPAPVSLPPQRVLLVDDNAALRQTLATVLAQRGHAVQAAATKAAAEALLQEHTFDLLVTDVLLPDGQGHRFAAQARLAQPDLRVVLMSGYAGPDLHPDALEGTHTTFLQKPFHPNRLLAAVAEVRSTRVAEQVG